MFLCSELCDTHQQAVFAPNIFQRNQENIKVCFWFFSSLTVLSLSRGGIQGEGEREFHKQYSRPSCSFSGIKNNNKRMHTLEEQGREERVEHHLMTKKQINRSRFLQCGYLGATEEHEAIQLSYYHIISYTYKSRPLNASPKTILNSKKLTNTICII